MSKKSPQSTSLDISVKLAILHTIGNTVYPSTARKIREAVANSIDNEATCFIISANRETNTLSLFDNGQGITWDRFHEIFTNLGYGLLKRTAGDKLSYFGLGLMSIFRLGKRAKIFTSSVNAKDVLCLNVETEKIFDPKNEDKPIEFLKDCIRLTDDGVRKRLASVAPSIEKQIIDIYRTVPKSYTEIVIEDVYSDDFDQVTDPNFETELRQLLPLPPEEKDPIFSRIKDPLQLKKLKELFKDKLYFPTIDVYLSIEEEKAATKLYKYLPEFKEELEFKTADIDVGISSSKKFRYFIIHTTEDLERSDKVGSETGFWVRNQNFLVKAADFFEKPGSRKKYIHEPLKKWMYGEIFHQNMNEFLTVARNDYIWESVAFKAFMEEAIQIVSKLNQTLRTSWQQKQSVINAIVKPFELLENSFRECSKTIEDMGIDASGREAEKILDKLAKRRKPELEKESNRIDQILRKDNKPIILADDEMTIVKIDPTLPEGETYQDQWDADAKKTRVSISPGLFNPKEVVFLGCTFTVYFVVEKETAAAISINKDKNEIYINAFNIDLQRCTLSFIDLYIAVEVADAMSADKREFKMYLLKLLGRKFPSVADYFGPLADDLMRKRPK